MLPNRRPPKLPKNFTTCKTIRTSLEISLTIRPMTIYSPSFDRPPWHVIRLHFSKFCITILHSECGQSWATVGTGLHLSMSDKNPITEWIDGLRAGEEIAAGKIWNHFGSQLREAARKRIAPDTRRVYDEEDAAQSAFQCLCSGLANGRFEDLADRESLWRLLLVITARKVTHRHRYDRQHRRNVRRTVNDSIFAGPDDNSGAGSNQLFSREPTPEFSAEFLDNFETLFEGLEDQELQSVVWLKLEGRTDLEVAERLSCSRRTIQRRLELIRRIWKEAHFD